MSNRFRLDTGCIIDQQENKVLSDVQVRNLLNKLNDENEQLKIFLEALKEELSLANRDNDTLEEENEQLKKRVEYLERKIQRERNVTNIQYEKWEKEALEKITNLEIENAKLNIEVEALKQIKPLRKLPRELTVLKLEDGDDGND